MTGVLTEDGKPAKCEFCQQQVHDNEDVTMLGGIVLVHWECFRLNDKEW